MRFVQYFCYFYTQITREMNYVFDQKHADETIHCQIK